MSYFSKMHQLLQKIMVLLRHPLTLGLLTIVVTAFFFAAENYWKTVPFALLILSLLTCLILVWSKRPVFSYYSAIMLLVVLTGISYFKFSMKGFSLHFFDVVFTGSDPEAIWFIWDAFTLQIVLIAALIVGSLVASFMLFSFEKSVNISRLRLSASAIISASLLVIFAPDGVKDRRHVYYLSGRHVTAFFVSLLDFQYLFVEDELQKRIATVSAPKPFSNDVTCGENNPDIFIVLSETQLNPADFPQMGMTKELKRQFENPNGPYQPLRVETFGGGTWISNFSLMTGLSSNYFGWQSPYLTANLEGKLKGTIPQILKECGYRTIAQIPFEFGFVNEGPFLKSIGFEDVIDRHAMNAPHYHMRDKFYFDAAEKVIAQHRKEDNRPLFYIIHTMFPHSPYNTRLLPQLKLEGEPFHDDADISEYLRRMLIARRDLEKFFDRREQDFGKRGMILMDFGDHQSVATKGFVEEIEGHDPLSQPDSLAYSTFYTLRRFSHEDEKTFTANNRIDIGLLGAKLLEFGQLPTTDVWRDLIDVDKSCNGELYGCAQQNLINQHFARRVSADLLNIAGN